MDRSSTENSQDLREYKDRTLPWKLIPGAILALFGAAMAPSIIAFVVGLVPISLALQNANWIPFIAIIVLILMISSIHVVLLGIPAFIAGWYLNRFRWWTSIAVAFVVGVLPTAVFLWPLKNPQLQTTSSRWDGEKMVQTMIQGVPTIAGWTDWLSAVMVMGLLGVSEGLVFWLI